ncbi:low affinity iron permease family protein [Mucilaginibacter sp. Bleaf8]|uniref:low affinity iron permease family protein n=1 Tax=Mucilaginibacter sp. Bleaf8 TaxID=2834430 RepID=UPI001BD1274A|nr:low affinity iron permease family protein [Mucilaginibacter sp. Bleaf8]MBS7566420.1 low affinity iron permease family protein [Mucilaginibacter sp. Bleaf8]
MTNSKSDTKEKNSFFERFSNKVTTWTGSSTAFIMACLVVIVWGASGPVFHYSETWQLVINTGTTIITFLMVFLIQKAQNKESKAIQLKLNELIAANRFTSNRMVDIEDLTEKELDDLRKFYAKLSDMAEEDDDIHQSHSIDAAEDLQEKKEKIQAATSKRKRPFKSRHRPNNDTGNNSDS